MFIKAIPSKSCADCVFNLDAANCLARVAKDNLCQKANVVWVEVESTDLKATFHSTVKPPHFVAIPSPLSKLK